MTLDLQPAPENSPHSNYGLCRLDADLLTFASNNIASRASIPIPIPNLQFVPTISIGKIHGHYRLPESETPTSFRIGVCSFPLRNVHNWLKTLCVGITRNNHDRMGFVSTTRWMRHLISKVYAAVTIIIRVYLLNTTYASVRTAA